MTSTPNSEAESDVKKRKKQFRFSTTNDLTLITQVVATFPYGLIHGKKIEGWKKVASALLSLGMEVDHRRCRERADVLIENFRKKETINQQLSGIDEEYTEMDRLLMDLIEMIDELESRNMEISEKKVRIINWGN
jgi:hypothetical protein